MTSGPVRTRSQRKGNESDTSSLCDRLNAVFLRRCAGVVSTWYPKQGAKFGTASYQVLR